MTLLSIAPLSLDPSLEGAGRVAPPINPLGGIGTQEEPAYPTWGIVPLGSLTYDPSLQMKPSLAARLQPENN